MAETKGITIQFRGETVDIDKSITSIDNGLKALKKEKSSVVL